MVGLVTFVNKGKTRKCEHCRCEYSHTAASQKFCRDCVPGDDPKERMKQRAAINLYGVDQQMWDAMYFEQDGKCLICEEREATCIDHCHETGRVRGLLCLGCNTLLGFIETPGRLEAALQYKSEGVY